MLHSRAETLAAKNAALFSHTGGFPLPAPEDQTVLLGTAILLISSELEEILSLSDRVAVLRDGKIVGTLPRSMASAEKIGPLMLAKSSAAASAA